jgi:molecular chaperone DnaK (HSP70)
LKVLNILAEPVAAAIAYKLQHNDDSIRHVLTFDLGGGTFDVAILKMSKGLYFLFHPVILLFDKVNFKLKIFYSLFFR